MVTDLRQALLTTGLCPDLATPPQPVSRVPIQSPYLTLEEAAEYTRHKKGSIYNAVYRGRLRKQPGSRKLLFTREALDSFLGSKPKPRR